VFSLLDIITNTVAIHSVFVASQPHISVREYWIDLDEMFVHFLKELMRNLFLMDMSAVRLVKPVHIHTFLKTAKFPLQFQELWL
jgi:hypothetical protein